MGAPLASVAPVGLLALLTFLVLLAFRALTIEALSLQRGFGCLTCNWVISLRLVRHSCCARIFVGVIHIEIIFNLCFVSETYPY